MPSQSPDTVPGRGPLGMAGPPTPLDQYAVLGHPVAHSRSPRIHAAFAAQTGQALAYGRLDCGPDAAGFEAALRDFAADPARRGCNVTVPFKFEAACLVGSMAGRLTPRAALAQAVNTLRFDAPGPVGWLGDNTDGVGLVHDLVQHAGFNLAGARVLLVGAGGAAAGVLGALLQARPAALVLVNRSADRATALAARHAALATAQAVALSTATLAAPGTGFDLVINASASSLAGVAAPVPAAVLRPGTLAVDLMYGPAAAPFLAWAAAAGAVPRDGLGMLVAQAAEAFFVWRGVRPETTPMLAALRAEADAA